MTKMLIAPVLFALSSFATAGAAQAAPQRIPIPAGDVVALTEALANPSNAGATVVLAPGVYVLTDVLVLQPNMQLVGANRYQDLDGDGVWDARNTAGTIFADPATETILDGSHVLDSGMDLVACGGQSYHAATVHRPLIQMTAGNAVRDLTVRGSKGPAIAPVTDAARLRGHGVHFEVTGATLAGNAIGVGAIHHDCTFAELDSDVTVDGSVFLANDAAGILFTNTLATGARWHGSIRHNRLTNPKTGNGMALNAAGFGCDDGQVSVESEGNIFEGNGTGVLVNGGKDTGAILPQSATGANGNRTEWISRGDAIWNNVGRGGIVTNGSVASPAGPASNDNSIRLTLLDTRFVKPGTAPASANSFGVQRRDVTLSGGVGTGNDTRILVRGASSDGVPGSFKIADTAGNTIVVIGSDVAFVHANEGVPE